MNLRNKIGRKTELCDTPCTDEFMLQKSYWGCRGRPTNVVETEEASNGGPVNYGENSTLFEDAPLDARIGIKVRDLTKVSYVGCHNYDVILYF